MVSFRIFDCFAGVAARGLNVGKALVPAVLLTQLLLSPVKAEEHVTPRLRINLSKDYPLGPGKYPTRLGMFPIFHRTLEGHVALLGGHLSDPKEPHALISKDRGKTWSEWEAFGSWPRMIYNDVVRKDGRLFAFGFNNRDCYEGTYVWWSKDEGKTWKGGRRLLERKENDRWSPMSQRALLTRNGRLILPVERLLGAEGPGANVIGTIISDDEGVSWRRGPMFGPPPPLPDRPEGFGEPACVELADGRIWMVFRTRLGHLWQAFSSDGGLTWGKPAPTDLVSPLSSVNARRLPGSNAVIVLWNNRKPGDSTEWGKVPSLWHPRSPLVFAVSHDNCRTWSKPITVETGTAIYPSICFSDGEMLLSYRHNPDPNAGPRVDFDLIFSAYSLEDLLSVRPSK